jgi:saccharopine dehydrogenase-like NADP-dependent oxidoreductase
MRVLALGGAGRICREAVIDLVAFSDFERITIADSNIRQGRWLVEALGDARVDFAPIDIRDRATAVSQMRGYKVVMDGTTIRLNGLSTACIAQAGCHGINLNGFGEEYQLIAAGKVPGAGVIMPEFAFDPQDVFRALEKREIFIHEDVTLLDNIE